MCWMSRRSINLAEMLWKWNRMPRIEKFFPSTIPLPPSVSLVGYGCGSVDAHVHKFTLGLSILWCICEFARSHSRSVSGCSPDTLFVDDHVFFCRELVGIMRKHWHVESVFFGACDQESAVDDHVQCVHVTTTVLLCTCHRASRSTVGYIGIIQWSVCS